MLEFHRGNGCCVWTADGHRGRIEYSGAILDRIRELAVEGLFRSRHGGLEIGGVLFGTRQGEVIRILDSRPVPCEHAFGPSFALSANDEAALGVILAEPPGGLEPLGWYQSHTRSGVSLSEREIEFFDRHFSKPWQIVMIVRPEPFGSAQVGFFLKDAEGKLGAECTGGEFAASQPERGSPAPAAEKPTPAIASPFVAVVPEVAPAPLEPVLPRGRKWAAPALAAAASVLAATGLYLFARPRPVALQAWDVGGQLRIEWNRRAEAVKNAERGALEIRDGSSRLELPFDAEHLRRGSVTYARHSGNVDVRLRIYRSGAPLLEEFTRFVGQPAPETPPAPVPVAVPLVEASNAATVTPRPVEPAPLAAEPAPAEAKAPERGTPAKPTEKPEKEVRSERDLQRFRPPIRLPLRLPPPRPSPAPAPVAPPPALPQLRAMAGPLSALPAASQQLEAPKPPPIVQSPSQRTGAAPEPAKPVYTGPPSGRLIWTGQLGQGAVLSIDGRHASTGFVNGELPGVPVRFSIHPAELSSKGLRVFSSDARYAGDLQERPGPSNGWNQTVYTWNPRRAREIMVLEAPGLQNGWKKLALRNDSDAFAVILIDWSVLK